jgi:hypothetical protein
MFLEDDMNYSFIFLFNFFIYFYKQIDRRSTGAPNPLGAYRICSHANLSYGPRCGNEIAHQSSPPSSQPYFSISVTHVNVAILLLVHICIWENSYVFNVFKY